MTEMKNPFDTFEKIFCINLDSRPDRWSLAQEEFKKVGIEDRVERMPGTIHEANCLGCFLSHLKCIKYAKDNKLDNVLIFEDDVEFVHSDLQVLASGLDELQKHIWRIFYLGGLLHKPSKLVSKNLIRVRRMWAGQSYAVHSSVYNFILGPKMGHVDFDNNTLRPKRKAYGGPDSFYARKLQKRFWEQSYCLYPLMCVQRPDYSDSEGVYLDRKSSQLQKVEMFISNKEEYYE